MAKIDGEVYIRVLVTRGIGDLTYDLKATPDPSIVIIVKPHIDPPPEVYTNGVRVVIVDVVRNHPESVNPMIKSNSLMNSALAMQEALRTGAFEGVMRNYRGELTECTTSNLFIVKNGVALTPPLESGLLPGITREFLFDVGKTIDVDVREQVLRDDDLFGADEAFLTKHDARGRPHRDGQRSHRREGHVRASDLEAADRLPQPGRGELAEAAIRPPFRHHPVRGRRLCRHGVSQSRR